MKMRTERMQTNYIFADPRKCTSCWNCIEACPKQVFSKAGFLWHKHIVIKNAANCIGCKKCMEVCPHSVFSNKIPEIQNTYQTI